MKATIRLPRMTVEVEGQEQKDLFQAAAQAYEVFGEKECGLCGSEDIVPVVRKVLWKKKECDYHEWHCQKPGCRARLSLSPNMEGGTLFANRRLLPDGKPATGEDREKGEFGPHNGWTRYRGPAKAD